MPGMLQIMKLVELAKSNREEWKDKVNEIKSHNAGAEVAMDYTVRSACKDNHYEQYPDESDCVQP